MTNEQIKAQLEICNNRLTCEVLREILRLREALEDARFTIDECWHSEDDRRHGLKKIEQALSEAISKSREERK